MSILLCIPAMASGIDPMLDPSIYSLSVTHDGWVRDSYFPLGMLHARDNSELVEYGLDFTETAVGSVAFAISHKGEPLTPIYPPYLGLFTACWSRYGQPTGRQIDGYGTFNDPVSLFDPNECRFLKDADVALVKSYGAASRPVMMWSLDNEWEGELDYGPEARAQFLDYLQKTYGSISELNSAWGTDYKSWEAVVLPVYSAVIERPAAWLDWHDFQDQFFTRLMADRVRAIYTNDPFHRPVALKTTQLAIDRPACTKDRVLDPALLADLTRDCGGWLGMDIYGSDDVMSFETNFCYQSIRPVDVPTGGHFFLTECNNHSGPEWQFANTFWRALANGVKGFDFFACGRLNASGDDETYAMSAPDTTLRPKMPYCIRLANSVRRTEDFWARSNPAPASRVAILVNRRDVLLADNPVGSKWDFSTNSRLKIYTALRDSGYFVDVIPYTKLSSGFLKQYSALVLVGCDHLTSKEAKEIESYTRAGGVVLADMLAGYYDEHHRVHASLSKMLGVKVNGFSLDGRRDLWFTTRLGLLRGDNMADVTGTRASAIGRTTRGENAVFLSHYGKGKAIYVATLLGLMRNETPGSEILPRWVSGLLSSTGVKPSYRTSDGAQLGNLRVEAPWIDEDGNLCLVVAGNRPVATPRSTIVVHMPHGDWSNAVWANAEDMGLTPVAGKRLSSGEWSFTLPSFKTAGMLLFFHKHAPLLAVPQINTLKRGVDGYLPVLAAGKAQKVAVSLCNPSDSPCPVGSIQVRALQGWKVNGRIIKTPSIPAHGSFRYEFEVTAPATGVLPYKERMYPINLRWSRGGKALAVCTTFVGVDVDNSTLPKILSDNADFPPTYPHKIVTGAKYRYILSPDQKPEGSSDPCTAKNLDLSGKALQDGCCPPHRYEKIALLESIPDVTIEFDLGKVYPLHEVRLLPAYWAGGGGYADGMSVSGSVDGSNFTDLGSAKPVEDPRGNDERRWLSLRGLECKSARFVRLKVHLKAQFGFLDEVQIWGYDAKKD